MQFGMPTLIETPDLGACVRLCKELGLAFIELNMNLPEYQPDTMDVQAMARICANDGIYFTIHLDENLNVCDFNRKVADAYCETMLQTIEIAAQLEIPVLNMHMPAGIYFSMPTERIYLFNRYTDLYIESLRDFRRMCEQAIGTRKIRICLENLCWSPFDFMISGIEVLLESPVFGLTFDTGYNSVCGGADETLFSRYNSRLHHMHLHDALGRRDHLALGTGELDVHACLDMADASGARVVLETKTIAGLTQSVEWLRDNTSWLPGN